MLQAGVVGFGRDVNLPVSASDEDSRMLLPRSVTQALGDFGWFI